MTNHISLALFGLILSFLTPDLSWAHLPGSGICKVPTKNSSLARDQRDALRTECLKQNQSKISVSMCLKIAEYMEYSTAAEETRLFCLQNLVRTAQECIVITRKMEYPDSGDEARWECLRRFPKNLSKKQCASVARDMDYPANTDRAREFCKQQHE